MCISIVIHIFYHISQPIQPLHPLINGGLDLPNLLHQRGCCLTRRLPRDLRVLKDILIQRLVDQRQGGDFGLSGLATGSRLDRKSPRQEVASTGSRFDRKSPGVNPASWYGSKS